jgi:serine/arginine repetitive matrix protein 1
MFRYKGLFPFIPVVSAQLTRQVDLRKVNIQVLRPWIAKKVTEMIKFEDDVVVEYVFGMLEDRDSPVS